MYHLFATLIAAMPVLAAAADVSEVRLRAHVEMLASEIGERNVWRPKALAAAEAYIRRTFEAQGYRVNVQEFDYEGRRVANLEVERRGTMHPQEIIVVGAHYDSVRGSPGANDNGSGVAALLELARHFAGRETARTVRFVAFVNEEPPFFHTDDMGSGYYARAARGRNDDIRAMFSLETIGYYRDEPNSQHYPAFLSFFYPDRGNFLGFVANFRSRRLMQQAVTAFRAASDFPVEHIATFAAIPGIDWSDHYSFWRQGYPALMITDTALYRYPHYHSAHDTPDKLDYRRFSRATEGLIGMLATVADAP